MRWTRFSFVAGRAPVLLAALGILTATACAPSDATKSPVATAKHAVNSCPQFALESDLATTSTATDSMRPGPLDPYASFGKVILAQDTLIRASRRGEVVALQSAGATDMSINGGTEYSVTVRESCLRSAILAQNDARAVEITSALLLDPRNRGNLNAVSPSALRSYIWRLPRATTLSGLKALAGADACVVGLSESVYANTSDFRQRARVNETQPSDVLLDPLVSEQGHLSTIGASSAYEALARLPLAGKPVIIAVIDTGIDMDHADLKDVLWRNPGEIPNNGIDDDRNGYVDDVNGYNFADNTGSPQYSGTWAGDQHGTHVSGLAAAQGGNGIGGSGVIGTDARVMMLNVFGSSKGANVSYIANAIRYAVDNGADVINLSLGGQGMSATYESALAYAIRHGVFVAAAAGNEKSELGPDFFETPASYARRYPGMLAVASIDSDDGMLSIYSNYGPDYVALGAPGSESSRRGHGLLSTWPGGGYKRIQGTSMASPVVAGAAAFAVAMLRERGYAPTAATIAHLLQVSARQDPGLASYVHNGATLDLGSLAGYIDANYSIRNSSKSIDPGVPACGKPQK